MPKTIFTLTVILGVLLTSAGCSRNEFGTVYVSGIVSVDDIPAEGVNVSFIPKSEGTLRECYGTTDAEGRYELSIPGTRAGSGAIPGEYIALFSKTIDPLEGKTKAEIAQVTSMPVLKNMIPEKYANAVRTDVPPVTVKKGKNTLDFTLATK